MKGCVGTFVFSFTDDWFTHGCQIEDWAFGLRAARSLAQAGVRGGPAVFRNAPQVTQAASCRR